MDEARVRAMIQAHFDASNVSAAGGGPEDEIARVGDLRRPRRHAVAAGRRAPARQGEHHRFQVHVSARQQFELHRTTGCHDLWVNEYTIRYDDRPVMAVGIMEFRDDKVVRERIYFGEPWEPPAWRAQWVERFDP